MNTQTLGLAGASRCSGMTAFEAHVFDQAMQANGHDGEVDKLDPPERCVHCGAVHRDAAHAANCRPADPTLGRDISKAREWIAIGVAFAAGVVLMVGGAIGFHAVIGFP